MLDLLNYGSLLAWLTLAWPLWCGWRAVRPTSLRHTHLWLTAAWLTWTVALVPSLLNLPLEPLRYLALSVSACAGVAVLGARQPGMAAWNFVVGGLLAVQMLPLLQQPWRGLHWQLEGPWALFLAGVVLVGLGNYLPTRWQWAVVGLGLWFGYEFAHLVWPEHRAPLPVAAAVVAVLLWRCAFRRPAGSEFDRTWRSFRDSYGLVWAMRAREQFNNAAQHEGWHARLGWKRLVGAQASDPPEEMLAMLRAVLKRFVGYAS